MYWNYGIFILIVIQNYSIYKDPYSHFRIVWDTFLSVLLSADLIWVTNILIWHTRVQISIVWSWRWTYVASAPLSWNSNRNHFSESIYDKKILMSDKSRSISHIKTDYVIGRHVTDRITYDTWREKLLITNIRRSALYEFKVFTRSVAIIIMSIILNIVCIFH